MDYLKERVLGAYERCEMEGLKSILAGTDLDTLHASGSSIVEILDAAIRGNDQRLAESCIVAGIACAEQLNADANDFDALFGSMAMAAAKWDMIEILDYCLDHGAEPTTYLGNAAAARGHERIFELLMSRGLDINAGYGFAGDALCTAVSRGHLKMAEFLIDNGADLTDKHMLDRVYPPLACAAIFSSVDMLELLLSRGVAIEESLALHQASSFGRIHIVEYLIKAGADVDEMPQEEGSFVRADYWAGRPIHFAAQHQRPEVMKILLENGADSKLLNSKNQTIQEVSARAAKYWGGMEKWRKEREVSRQL